MEVVLLEDVKALGKKGQIVKVSDGYGRNFILTKKLGIEATPKNLNDLKLQKANEAKIAAEHLAAAKDLAKHLEDKSITLSIWILTRRNWFCRSRLRPLAHTKFRSSFTKK